MCVRALAPHFVHHIHRFKWIWRSCAKQSTKLSVIFLLYTLCLLVYYYAWAITSNWFLPQAKKIPLPLAYTFFSCLSFYLSLWLSILSMLLFFFLYKQIYITDNNLKLHRAYFAFILIHKLIWSIQFILPLALINLKCLPIILPLILKSWNKFGSCAMRSHA